MTTRRARPTAGDFTFGAATPPHRTPDADPAPTVAAPAQPAPSTQPTVSDSPEPASDAASKLASQLAASPKADTPARAGMSIPLSALMTGQLDPDMDLVGTGVRVPRYVSEALRLTSVISRTEQQRIVTEALKAYLPPELLDETYRNATGGTERAAAG